MNHIYHGDALTILKTLESESVDCCVTDPPYELGFMGKKWDKSGITYNVDLWREVLRVLKPGAYLLSFGGARTYHRMACAIEDAGFEIRDMIEWVYGSGFPKSLDIGKAIDKLQGNERHDLGEHPNARKTVGSINICKKNGSARLTKGHSKYEGYGTALKPSHEPICMARKPLSEKTVAENVLKWGTGGINIDGCRVGTEEITQTRTQMKTWREKEGRTDIPESADNSQTSTQGRFPANIIHDGSEEVLLIFPKTKSGSCPDGFKGNYQTHIYGKYANNLINPETVYADKGSAARFFYTAKASPSERGKDNNHPTVKPLALMQYLIKLVCPPHGTILEPFLGSGTTMRAAIALQRECIGIDLGYEDIQEKRTKNIQVELII